MTLKTPVVNTGRSASTRRLICFCVFVAVLVAIFSRPLASLVSNATNSDLNSYILLVPFVSAYLLYLRRDQLPAKHVTSPGWTFVPLLIGLVALVIGKTLRASIPWLSANDELSLIVFSFDCFLIAGALLFLGRDWVKAAAFPIAFLFFLVPLPDRAVFYMETASKLASAEAAHWFFKATATPVFREGNVFQLPGVVIEVAQECSGIRSSLVLFIASILAANLFLTSPWRRIAVVALVIPLGIIRNGFRILVIGLLCVHVGPQMIHSVIHKRGGPLFFALSLPVLFFVIWLLRRGDAASSKCKPSPLPEVPVPENA